MNILQGEKYYFPIQFQTKFAYSPLEKYFEKQRKTIESAVKR